MSEQLPVGGAWRRGFDVVVSAGALTVLSVPLLLVAGLVALGAKGPVIYRQTRIGRRGRPFEFYKFRTMRVGASGSAVTVGGDSRIYPVGRWLRRLKLDELPQFWNVLRGDMSIIGPRPEVERFVRCYDAAQRRILDGKPGLASRSALVYADEAEFLRDAPDPEEAYIKDVMPRKLAVDLAYERTRTFWSDLRLLAELALFVAGRNDRADNSLLAAHGPRGNDPA